MMKMDDSSLEKEKNKEKMISSDDIVIYDASEMQLFDCLLCFHLEQGMNKLNLSPP